MIQRVVAGVLCTVWLAACGSARTSGQEPPVPRQIIDLSPTITEDLPVRVWGQKPLRDFGITERTEFHSLAGGGAYWTLFTHAGPHVDAPNHMPGGTKGIDSYTLDSIVGPIRLIDVRGRPVDEPITIDELNVQSIHSGDIVMILTGYVPPTKADEVPSFRALSKEAAEYLAKVPVKAFATDGLSIDSFREEYRKMEQGVKEYELLAPVHSVLLGRAIPAIEQLTNVEALLGVSRAMFVGLPLKVKDADGSPIRAAAFIY